MPEPRSPKPWKEYGRYGSVGIELVASIMAGYYGGHWLDGKIGGGKGYLTALGFVVGVYAGFRALFATAKKLEADVLRAEQQERERHRERRAGPWKSDDVGTTTAPRVERAPSSRSSAPPAASPFESSSSSTASTASPSRAPSESPPEDPGDASNRAPGVPRNPRGKPHA